MGIQPRRPAGTTTGGQFTINTAPTFDGQPQFVNQPETCSESWSVEYDGTETTFTRHPDGSVTSNVDDPSLWMLAHKGDRTYWHEDRWRKNPDDLRAWSSELVAGMLQDGLVPVVDETNTQCVDGVSAVMHAATDQPQPLRGVYALCESVAKIRALRFVQSMMPQPGMPCWLDIGGWRIPAGTYGFLQERVHDVRSVFSTLPRNVWSTGGDGFVTDSDTVFVGPGGDLLWRALTETDFYGQSPLMSVLRQDSGSLSRSESLRRGSAKVMVAAGVLCDSVMRQQVTVDVVRGLEPQRRVAVQNRVVECLTGGLSHNGGRLWDPSQKASLTEIIADLEASEL